MQLSHAIFALCCPLFVVACSTPTDLMDQREMDALANTPTLLMDAKVCCTQFSEITYTPIVIDKKKVYLDVVISDQSPAYEFSSGKSFFKAFQLPENKGRYNLMVESKISDTAFKPQVMILNEGFEVTRIVESEAFQMEKQFVGDELIVGTVKFDTTSSIPGAKEKYFIVYTTDQALTETTKRLNWNVELSKAKGVDPIKGMDKVSQHAAVGNVVLTVVPTSASAYFGSMQKTTNMIPIETTLGKSGPSQADIVAYYLQHVENSLKKDDVKTALQWLKEAKYIGDVSETAFAMSYAAKEPKIYLDEMMTQETRDYAQLYIELIYEYVKADRMLHALELLGSAQNIGEKVGEAFEKKK